MTFRPRIRTLKPEMWADEKVGQLSRDARLLFVGLITMADDEGRLRGMPAGILGHVFPYDVDALRKLDGWLRELVKSDLVKTYEHGGVTYFYLPGFVKHQVINKAKASTLPVAGPSAERIETVAVPDSDGTKTVGVRASRARGGTERNGEEEKSVGSASERTGLAATVSAVESVLTGCSRLHVDRMGVESAMAQWPKRDAVRAAHTVVTWATDPGFRNTNGAKLLADALSKQTSGEATVTQFPKRNRDDAWSTESILAAGRAIEAEDRAK